VTVIGLFDAGPVMVQPLLYSALVVDRVSLTVIENDVLHRDKEFLDSYS